MTEIAGAAAPASAFPLLQSLARGATRLSLIIAVAAALIGAAPAGAAARPAERACSDDPTVHQAEALGNFADPFVFCDGGVLHAVASNWHDLKLPARYVLVPIARFKKDSGWFLEQDNGRQRDAMVHAPPWSWPHPPNSDSRDLWAPEIKKVGAAYVLYFSARHASAVTPGGRHRPCIGAAVSAKPDRDFVPQSTPLLCTEFAEGMIDPSPVEEDGKLYLSFKVDGNCCGLRAGLYVTELTSDGLAVVGSPQALGVVHDRPWEGSVVEAPTLVKRGDGYVLFYSAETFSHPEYGVGYALCARVTGPCEKPKRPTDARAGDPNRRVLRTREGLEGPGHQAVFTSNGRSYVAFHALLPDTPHDDRAERRLHITPLDWLEDQPVPQSP